MHRAITRVVEAIQAEIKETGRNRLVINEDMFLVKMPAARAHQ